MDTKPRKLGFYLAARGRSRTREFCIIIHVVIFFIQKINPIRSNKFPQKGLTNRQIRGIILIEKGKEMTAMKKNITINFDMDGTIADLYGVANWLDCVTNGNTFPYENARPLVKMNELANRLNALQRNGYQVAIITWLARGATEEYNKAVTTAKLNWLANVMPTVHWDRITVVPYGTPKENFCNNHLDVLFDDEEPNRTNWTGRAYDVNNILEVLAEM
jgi:hypothetical protein